MPDGRMAGEAGREVAAQHARPCRCGGRVQRDAHARADAVGRARLAARRAGDLVVLCHEALLPGVPLWSLAWVAARASVVLCCATTTRRSGDRRSRARAPCA